MSALHVGTGALFQFAVATGELEPAQPVIRFLIAETVKFVLWASLKVERRGSDVSLAGVSFQGGRKVAMEQPKAIWFAW